MTSRDPLLFRTLLARKMAEKLRERVRFAIPSRTLRNSIQVRVTVADPNYIGAEIFLPQYWAVYYHDGRGPVRPRNGKYLVYFANIEDDPRVAGGKDYPTRTSQIRRLRLSPEEFRAAVQEGKLIVRKSVGPSTPHRFFDKLEGRAVPLTAGQVLADFRAHAKLALEDVLRLKGSIRLRTF